jgi:hypothetical protein
MSALGARTSTRRPSSSAVGRRLRADAREDRRVVRLAGDADEVAHGAARGEQHRVEPAALERLARLGGRRRRPDGAVGGDVVDLPAELLQPGEQRVGRDVGARQQHAVDRVEDVVVRGEVGEQALARLLPARHEVGAHAEVDERLRGRLADRPRPSPRTGRARRGRTPRASRARP